MPDKYNRDPQPESDGGAGFTVTKQLLPGQSLLEFDFTDTHYRDLLVVKSDASNSWRLADAKFKLESINLDDPAAGGTISREVPPTQRRAAVQGSAQRHLQADRAHPAHRIRYAGPP